jgi:hypothetical protein
MLGESKILKQILERLDRLIGVLERQFHTVPAKRLTLIQNGGNLSTSAFSLVAGGPPASFTIIPLPSGSALDLPADLELTSTDPLAVITNDPTDPSGATFDVSVPASDTSATIELDATGLNSAGVAISGGPFEVAVTPSAPPPPPSPASALGLVQNSGQAPTSIPSPTASAKTAAPAHAAAATKARVK